MLKTRQRNFYHTRVSPLRGPLESEKITLPRLLKSGDTKFLCAFGV
ncbi:MAG: hypothetical protein US40_C0003G0040 [Candidatus Roizmanbacteria bacterium GW2011_GWC2_37_13]|uniref:Uncharacterized protein n=1 Tax=Candidatus Roizmanbacteria bacterium GW2011_GWC2_37_13 TaxID=1618486 RepID=A0A0G0G513_9BACT|nr:MAG: hypothetical protein US40_C0003G0040 [Candidatus Roizmanbacteria bacterium GW2011_GWC2_37_13]